MDAQSPPETNRLSTFVEMTGRQLAQVLIIGALVGVVIWGLGSFLEASIFRNWMCQQSAESTCAPAQHYAVVVANIVGGAVGLASLLRMRVFRPLLIVLAATVSLWGLAIANQSLAWQFLLAMHVSLYALAYGAFAWIARVKQFWLVIVLFIALIMLSRLLLTR